MDGERRHVRREVPRVRRLDRLGGAEMEALLARQAQLLVERLAHERVCEGIGRRRPAAHLDHQVCVQRLLDGGE